MAKEYIHMPRDYQEMGVYYDKMSAELYDAMMASINYTEPAEIMKSVKDLGLDTETTKVLDVGAGTGLIGLMLVEQGFKKIDAVDASEALLASLKEKKIYDKVALAWLGYGKLPEKEDVGKYDLVTAAGVFMCGHMPASSLTEIVDYVKQGGHFVTALRTSYYTPGEAMGYYEGF